MPLYPNFKRDQGGQLDLRYTPEAIQINKKGTVKWSPPLGPKVIQSHAEEKVRSRHGDTSDEKDVLGEYMVQFSRFKGHSFRWMLENAAGWVAWLLVTSENEDKEGTKEGENAKANKAAFKKYVLMFDEVHQLVNMKKGTKPQKAAEPQKAEPQKAKRLSPANVAHLLRSKHLSPEQITKKIAKMTSPPKFSPNIPNAEDRELVTSVDEYELSTCLDNYEQSQKETSTAPSLQTALGSSTVKRRLFLPSLTTLAPAPKETGIRAKRDNTEPAGSGRTESSDAVRHEFDSSSATSSGQCELLAPVQSKHTSTQDLHQPDPENRSRTEQQATDQPYGVLSATTSGQSEFPTPVQSDQTFTQDLHQPDPENRSRTEQQATDQPDGVLSATTSGQSEFPTPVQSDQTFTQETLLYWGWKSTMPAVDQQWVSKLLFGLNANNKLEFRTDRLTQLWFEPPQPSLHAATGVTRVQRYFGHRLFVWMPVTIWGVQLHCPHTDTETPDNLCRGILTKSGMYQKTRIVLDVDTFYMIATEYLRCSKCGKKLVAWAHNIVSQLDEDRRLLFPCILTERLACDRKVVHLLRHRGLGNSSSSVWRQLEESHGDLHLRNVHHYLTACKTTKAAGTSGLICTPRFEAPPAMMRVPQHKWLMKVYQLDILQRIDFIKASMTSLFGTILKMDSTKKITKKLAGKSEKTSMWATNVGNEFGQVIMTVLTASEGKGLAQMTNGICHRYTIAEVDQPKVLYVDRDCCGSAHVGRYFAAWSYVLVRLDIWHFMRRLSVGCTTDCHPLYGTFMNRLSRCIFRWEEEDVRRLKEAKRAEMIQRHVPNPSDADVIRKIKTDELALHCRRVTRGTEETTTLISQLIESMEGDKGLDILGVPLFDDMKMQQIWALQSRHVCCLQDPEDVQLYTRLGTLKKGGVELPKYRCARGSTSLESFHLHMNRFIPGTLANDVNFQTFLLDGVHRWNQDRQQDATAGQASKVPLSYNGQLKDSVNRLAKDVLGEQICPSFKLPGKYTGELIGVEYLYSQSTGASVKYREAMAEMEETDSDGDIAEEVDDVFDDQNQFQDLTVPALDQPVQHISGTQQPLLPYPTNEEYQQLMTDTVDVQIEEPLQLVTPAGAASENVQPEPDDSDIGPDNIPGYRQVLVLATCLYSLKEQTTPLSTEQAKKIIRVWETISDYDKSRTKFPPRFSSAGTGRFKSPKKQVALGVTSIQRAILGPNATRASWPNCNRYVEATVEQLLVAYPSDRRSKGDPTISRWTLVKEGYERIQTCVNSNKRVMDNTDIQLPSLNTKTITQWFNIRGKDKDQKILLQGIELPKPAMTGVGAPQPKEKPPTLQTGKGEEFKFLYHPDTAGMAKRKVRRPTIPAQSTSAVRELLPRPPHLLTQPTSTLRQLLPKPSTFATPIQTSEIPSKAAKKRTPVKQGGMEKRKYTKTATTVKCSKCGKERLPPAHKQYMGFRYCAETSTIPFEQWRASLKNSRSYRKDGSGVK